MVLKEKENQLKGIIKTEIQLVSGYLLLKKRRRKRKFLGLKTQLFRSLAGFPFLRIFIIFNILKINSKGWLIKNLI